MPIRLHVMFRITGLTTKFINCYFVKTSSKLSHIVAWAFTLTYTRLTVCLDLYSCTYRELYILLFFIIYILLIPAKNIQFMALYVHSMETVNIIAKYCSNSTIHYFIHLYYTFSLKNIWDTMLFWTLRCKNQKKKNCGDNSFYTYDAKVLAIAVQGNM